ncbi:hypothetical protein [Mycolicibacterium celeriflavum]|uniref:hypothetical protein n=1 Tax=Mycolicibacterium celeriflavum TaxID=1249101 RepID=UPI003CE79347
MKTLYRWLPPLLAAGGVGVCALVTPIAGAAPECSNVAPNTTQCQTNGSSQIVTSPSVQTSPYWGWPYGGGLVIGLGGWHK